jgi:surface antigen
MKYDSKRLIFPMALAMIVSLLFSIVFLVSSSAFAVNYGFLSNTAMSYFTKDDWSIFNKTQDYVLNHAKNGIKVSWKNPKSGNYGYMVASSAPSQNGMLCRRVAFFNVGNLIKGDGSYTFCKSHNKWMIYS